MTNSENYENQPLNINEYNTFVDDDDNTYFVKEKKILTEEKLESLTY
jgi:hypothetical protein